MGCVDRLVLQRRRNTREKEILICAYDLSMILEESQPLSMQGAAYSKLVVFLH